MHQRCAKRFSVCRHQVNYSNCIAHAQCNLPGLKPGQARLCFETWMRSTCVRWIPRIIWQKHTARIDVGSPIREATSRLIGPTAANLCLRLFLKRSECGNRTNPNLRARSSFLEKERKQHINQNRPHWEKKKDPVRMKRHFSSKHNSHCEAPEA